MADGLVKTFINVTAESSPALHYHFQPFGTRSTDAALILIITTILYCMCLGCIVSVKSLSLKEPLVAASMPMNLYLISRTLDNCLIYFHFNTFFLKRSGWRTLTWPCLAHCPLWSFALHYCATFYCIVFLATVHFKCLYTKTSTSRLHTRQIYTSSAF